jgi:ketosteroid isomerase-like protein
MPTMVLDGTTRDLQLLDEEFTRSVRMRDVARLVEHFYAPEAQLMVPGRPQCRGRAEIEAYYRRAFEQGLIDFRRETNQFEAEHDLACAVGRYTRTCETQPGLLKTVHGHYTVIFRRQGDGHWRAIADSSAPID